MDKHRDEIKNRPRRVWAFSNSTKKDLQNEVLKNKFGAKGRDGKTEKRDEFGAKERQTVPLSRKQRAIKERERMQRGADNWAQKSAKRRTKKK